MWILLVYLIICARILKRVKAFIGNGRWSIPADLITHLPQLQSEVQEIVIPFVSVEDRLMWDHSILGNLTFKDSFFFHNPSGQVAPWIKTV